MKHFIFQNDITIQHLIIDAENVTEALYIMTLNSILTDHTYIGCADNILTISTNADPKILSKIEQFTKLCKLADLVEKVADLPKAPQRPIAPTIDYNSGMIYIRIQAIVKIEPYKLANTTYNHCFIDCYINAAAINGVQSLDDRIETVIEDIMHKADKQFIKVVKVGNIGEYYGPKGEMGKVAFTQMLDIIGDKESINSAYYSSKAYAYTIHQKTYSFIKGYDDTDNDIVKSNNTIYKVNCYESK